MQPHSSVAGPLADDSLWLGVDVGTQGVRAVLVDAAGGVAGSGSHPLTSSRRDAGRHEQDPEDWWTALCAATQQALQSHAGRAITAMSIDSTSGTILVERPDGSARGPGLMYDDARAMAEVATVQEVGHTLWSSLGYRMQGSWALPKMRWLIANDHVSAGDRIVHQGDHLSARLTGHGVATDTSSALKSGYDLVHLTWPDEVFTALSIDTGLLPDVVAPGTPIGTVSLAAADLTGIPAGTIIVAGMTDGCASQVAARALRPGAWSSALGTTLVIKGATDTLLLDPSGAVYCHRNPDGGWLPGGASSSGAGVVARELPGRDLDRLTLAVQALGTPIPGFVYPLVGAGERFPFVAAQAESVAVAAPETDAHTLGGLMQAVALVERLAYDVLAALGADITGPVTFSGGASRNPYWNQMRCNVLGRPVLLPGSVDAAVGSAIVAAAAPGSLAATAERLVHITSTLDPDVTTRDTWDETYHAFCAELLNRGWLDPSRLPDHLRVAVQS